MVESSTTTKPHSALLQCMHICMPSVGHDTTIILILHDCDIICHASNMPVKTSNHLIHV